MSPIDWYSTFITNRPMFLVDTVEWERVKKQIEDFFDTISALHKERGEFRFVFGFD